jgi:thiamine biosynthesis lipoprotein
VIVHAEPVMGTVFSFHVAPGERREPEAYGAIASACTRLHELDDIFSTWKPESPMTRFRSGLLSRDTVPREMTVVSALCESARELSRGWFDPWAMPGGFDPTGLVKGWAAEQALAVLELAGVEAAMVNGGGDIALFGLPAGAKAWRIGVRHPWRPDSLACVLETDRAVATSGCYERGPHLVDPRDGRMLFETASATVTGSCLAMCDALATALVVADEQGPEMARSLVGYEAYIVRSDGSEHATDGIVFGSLDESLPVAAAEFVNRPSSLILT